MNALSRLRAGCRGEDADAEVDLAAAIDAWAKDQIITAYSFGRCPEWLTVELIRENGLVNA